MESRIELLDDEGSKRVCIRTADQNLKAITEQVLLSALKVTHLIFIPSLSRSLYTRKNTRNRAAASSQTLYQKQESFLEDGVKQ